MDSDQECAHRYFKYKKAGLFVKIMDCSSVGCVPSTILLVCIQRSNAELRQYQKKVNNNETVCV